MISKPVGTEYICIMRIKKMFLVKFNGLPFKSKGIVI